jgi:hypothetical protein
VIPYDNPPQVLVSGLRRRFARRARVLTLDEWTTERSTDKALSPEDMLAIVDIATEALQGLYVHMDLKLARRGVDPVRQLNVFRERVAAKVDTRTFHEEMLRIFKSLGDAHTAYRLPPPHKFAIAFLPFVINAFEAPDGTRRYVVSHVLKEGERPFKSIHFVKGVEITAWNGIPIEDAVRAATDLVEGSNAPNDFLVALQFMTVRWLGASFGPEAPWVIVGYKDGKGVERESKFYWLTLELPRSRQIVVPPQAFAAVFEPFPSVQGRERSVHLASASVHIGRKALFVTETPQEERLDALEQIGREFMRKFYGYFGRAEMNEFTRQQPMLRRRRKQPDEHPTLLPLFLVAREHTLAQVIQNAGSAVSKKVKAASELRFGYIGIRAFPPSGFAREVFTYELRRLLNLMPDGGLILDIRDNPGGSANLAEESLQLLTPKPITPLPFRFVASPSTKALTDGGTFGDYNASIVTAMSTGGRFSAGRSLTPARHANEVGQHYFGPVVLLTNAATYSAADVFAAGFEDHELGPVIGVDETTGGGGANCWFYNEDVRTFLRQAKELKNGVNLQIAVRQCGRVGSNNDGVLIEEVGVLPKLRYSLTRQDVLDPRPWPLLLFAASQFTEVAGRDRHDLVTSLVEGNGIRFVTVQTENIDRLDFFVNGRPSFEMVNRRSAEPIASPLLPMDDRVELEIRGYMRPNTLVARYVQVFPFVG